MDKIRKFTVATCLASLWCVAGCGVDEAAKGDAAQQRVSLTKPSAEADPKLPAPKAELAPDNSDEERLRQLKNEGTRDKCLEALGTALGADERVEYREGDCMLKFKRTADEYIYAYLNFADATVSGQTLRFTCRNPNKQDRCVGTGSPVGTSSVGWKIGADADAAELQRCLDFLHERCKQM